MEPTNIIATTHKHTTSTMTGLIIIFSALGGTFGSQLIGYLSGHYTTHAAFHFPLIPMATLAVLLFFFRALCARVDAAGPVE